MDFSNLNIIKLKDDIFRVEKKNGKQIYVGHLKKKKPHGYGEYISKIDNTTNVQLQITENKQHSNGYKISEVCRNKK